MGDFIKGFGIGLNVSDQSLVEFLCCVTVERQFLDPCCSLIRMLCVLRCLAT